MIPPLQLHPKTHLFLATQSNYLHVITRIIYMPGEFGVRIEDDFVITENGVEQISTKVNKV